MVSREMMTITETMAVEMTTLITMTGIQEEVP
jgi:hypothetical protein